MPYKSDRRRDGQQWILDYMAKTAGMVQNFEDEKFELPRGVKNYKMISKLKGEEAAHIEAVTAAAEEAVAAEWSAVLGELQVEACIELGATTARHIRLFEPSWWETYPERPFIPDAIDALGDLQRAAQPPETDWRTPHEAGATADACAAYEIAQIEASVTYLKSIGAV